MADLSVPDPGVLAERARVRRFFRKIGAVSGAILVGGVPLCLGAPLFWGALLGTLGLFLGRAFLGPLVPAWLDDRLPIILRGLINLGHFCGLIGWVQAISGFSLMGSSFVWIAVFMLSFPLLTHDKRRK